jgi:hypothetical protein
MEDFTKSSEKPYAKAPRPESKMARNVVEHPLSSMTVVPNNTEESVNDQGISIRTPPQSTVINTAALIQSAARSVLDDTTTSTIFSDDESCAHGSHRLPRTSSTLRSLQTKTLPALPDEQDRKRFVVRRHNLLLFTAAIG